MIVPFKPKHIEQMALREHELAIGDLLIQGAYDLKGPGFSLIINNEVVGSAGIEIYWPGVGEAWASLSKLIYKYPLSVHREAIRGLDAIIIQEKLWRVQAAVMCSFTKAVKWIERLGFEREGIMRKYGPAGDDFYRYAMVIE